MRKVTNDALPAWLANNLNRECPYCGAPIVTAGETGLTQRYCPNPFCSGHMAQRIVILADRFNVSGVGPATARSFIRATSAKNHLEILPVWFPDKKPSVWLWEVGSLAMIYSLGPNFFKEAFRGYRSIEDYFINCPRPHPSIALNKNYLLHCEQYFDVRPPMSRNVINVMLTGHFQGYSSRDMFVQELNDLYGQYVTINNVGKRKRDVHFLIKEVGQADHSKSALAEQAGIPIVTPAEFRSKILDLVTYINEKEDKK